MFDALVYANWDVTFVISCETAFYAIIFIYS